MFNLEDNKERLTSSVWACFHEIESESCVFPAAFKQEEKVLRVLVSVGEISMSFRNGSILLQDFLL